MIKEITHSDRKMKPQNIPQTENFDLTKIHATFVFLFIQWLPMMCIGFYCILAIQLESWFGLKLRQYQAINDAVSWVLFFLLLLSHLSKSSICRSDHKTIFIETFKLNHVNSTLHRCCCSCSQTLTPKRILPTWRRHKSA